MIPALPDALDKVVSFDIVASLSISKKSELDEIIVSCGGKHSLHNACQSLFQSGDEVIVFTPYWVSFPDFISITGAKPVFVSTNPESQYEPVFKELESKINSKTARIGRLFHKVSL